MPTTKEKGNLRFTFDGSWDVVRLDKHSFYKERLMPLQLTRAVDFLALRRHGDLYFIEVKDFRGSAIELKNEEKMCDGDTLFLQVARKVKDSVVCIAGAARVLGEVFWSRCGDVLRRRQSIVKVVYWLEFDLGRRAHGRNLPWIQQEMRVQATARANELKARLNWLTKQVVVTNQDLDPGALPGVTVENVARAGH
jgi:hypothetical protein